MAWYTDEPFGVSWPNPPEKPTNFDEPPESDPEFGVSVATGGGAMYEYEQDREEANFPVPVLELVHRYATTTLEAVEMLARYNIYWGPCNCVVGDAHGNGALIEKSKYHYALRMSEGNVLVSTYGGCDDEDMKRMCDTSNPLFKYYERRVGAMREILAEAEAGCGIDGQAFWDSMLNHDEHGAGCQHRETMPEGIELFTHVAYYWLPAERRSFRRAIARDKGTVLYPCEVPVVEVRR